MCFLHGAFEPAATSASLFSPESASSRSRACCSVIKADGPGSGKKMPCDLELGGGDREAVLKQSLDFRCQTGRI